MSESNESNGSNNSNNSNKHNKDGYKLIGVWLSNEQVKMLGDISSQYRSPNRTHTLRLMIEDTYRKVMKGQTTVAGLYKKTNSAGGKEPPKSQPCKDCGAVYCICE